MLDFYDHMKDRIQGKAPKGAKRSPQWRKVRDEHLVKFPECEVCGVKNTKILRRLTVHHILPFHLFPDLELNPGNLMTLCSIGKYGVSSCHLLFGHLGNYRKINMNILTDVAVWKIKLQGHS